MKKKKNIASQIENGNKYLSIETSKSTSWKQEKILKGVKQKLHDAILINHGAFRSEERIMKQ